MLPLYHFPRSRASRIIRLIDELEFLDGIDIRIVDVAHNDGSGGRDPIGLTNVFESSPDRHVAGQLPATIRRSREGGDRDGHR